MYTGPDNGERTSEQDLWRQFESTGSVQEYLRYRRAQNAITGEKVDANDSDGAGAERDEARRG